MLSDEEKTALELIKINNKHKYCDKDDVDFLLNLIEKQKNIIDSTKRILYDEELDYCDTLDEIYHFYEEVVNNE